VLYVVPVVVFGDSVGPGVEKISGKTRTGRDIWRDFCYLGAQ